MGFRVWGLGFRVGVPETCVFKDLGVHKLWHIRKH